MTVTIETGISGDTQADCLQNGTQQSTTDYKFEYTVHTYLPITATTQRDAARQLKRIATKMLKAADLEGARIDIAIGRPE